uniref:SAM domain-containing protein n=1 Tax=Spermophilus dauricus TaxID=99837 RepID=A0A8C9UWJ6_SPEDA
MAPWAQLVWPGICPGWLRSRAASLGGPACRGVGCLETRASSLCPPPVAWLTCPPCLPLAFKQSPPAIPTLGSSVKKRRHGDEDVYYMHVSGHPRAPGDLPSSVTWAAQAGASQRSPLQSPSYGPVLSPMSKVHAGVSKLPSVNQLVGQPPPHSSAAGPNLGPMGPGVLNSHSHTVPASPQGALRLMLPLSPLPSFLTGLGCPNCIEYFTSQGLQNMYHLQNLTIEDLGALKIPDQYRMTIWRGLQDLKQGHDCGQQLPQAYFWCLFVLGSGEQRVTALRHVTGRLSPNCAAPGGAGDSSAGPEDGSDPRTPTRSDRNQSWLELERMGGEGMAPPWRPGSFWHLPPAGTPTSMLAAVTSLGDGEERDSTSRGLLETVNI